ncbi:MAG: 2-amino-4-hydroxy-6-hydroxymethyldihydropteridine diphosphokinase [Acidimicrobiia bacterium]|nr:2-amino-4-hydroxy-6-hydroxymethyldihydropteridine diphosphokinase [Acidimicrobiia bacterium]
MPVRAAIALGSNLGDRHGHLDAAVEALGRLGELMAVSAPVETDPVGGPPGQGPYLNAVAIVATDLEPSALLRECLAIEASRGRVREERWGPRTLDLDILLFGDRRVSKPGLTIPHPHMAERPFVLEPLAEVWPDARYPDGSLVQSRGRLAEPARGRLAEARGRLAEPEAETPSYLAVFLTTGMLAVGLWWLLDLILG